MLRGVTIAALSAIGLMAMSLGVPRLGHAQNKSQASSVDFDYASEHGSPFWEEVIKGNDDELRDRIAHAQVLWDSRGKYEREQALRELQEVVRSMPTSNRAIFLLGQFQYEARNWSACADALTRSYQLAPDYKLPVQRGYSHLQANLASCLLYAGRYEAAIDHLKRLLSRNPNSSNLDLQLGQALMASGRLHDALDALHSAQERSRTEFAGIAYAVALDRAERITESKAILRREVARRPDLTSLRASETLYAPAEDEHYYLGLAYAEQGRAVKAEYHFRRYLTLAPKSQWASRAQTHLEALGVPVLGAHLAAKGSADWQPDALRSAIQKEGPALRACLAGQPFVLASLSITGLVSPKGTAVDVQARITAQVDTAPTKLEANVECLESAARKIRIPKLSGVRGNHASVEFAVLGSF